MNRLGCGMAIGVGDQMRCSRRLKRQGNYKNNAMEIHCFDATEPFVGHDRFVVQYEADVTDKKSKERRKLSEVGVYTVKNGKIVRRNFAYAPAARLPRLH